MNVGTNNNSNTLAIEAQGSLVKVHWKTNGLTPLKATAVRGVITEFSRRSRKRLLELTARLDLKTATRGKPVVFITLTYGSNFPDSETAKNHLRALLERFRRFAPASSAVWRLEYQKRGAPHFHLIFYNLPYYDKDILQKAWADIIGVEYWDTSKEEPRYPFTRIEALKNARQVMYYVSKYVAKVDDAASGFNNLPYLHAGRFWGVFNRAFLPFAELLTTALNASVGELQVILWQFRRLMAKKWRSSNKYGRLKGASIFVDHSKGWYEAFLWCIMEYA